MSKKSKAKSKLKRLNQKRARKAGLQAQYESYKKEGRNRKSKRFRKNSKGNTVRGEKHTTLYCGNLGCLRCFDISNPWKVSPNSCLFSKRWTSSKWRPLR